MKKSSGVAYLRPIFLAEKTQLPQQSTMVRNVTDMINDKVSLTSNVLSATVYIY